MANTAPWCCSGEIGSLTAFDVIGIGMGGLIKINNLPFFGTKLFQDCRISGLRGYMNGNISATPIECRFTLDDGSPGTFLNSTISFDPAQSGWSDPSTAYDDLLAGTVIKGWASGASGAGVGVLSALSFNMTPNDTDLTVSKLTASGTSGSTVVDPSSPYIGFVGQLAPLGSATETEFWCGDSFTVRNLFLGIGENTRTSDTLCYVYKNGAPTGVVITIPAGDDGYFDSGITSDSVVDGDRIIGKFEFGAGSGLIRIRIASVELISNAGVFTGGLGQNGRVYVLNPDSFPMAGLNSTDSGGYAPNTQFGFDWVLTKQLIHILSAASDSTLTVVQNEVPTSMVVAIPAGTGDAWKAIVGELPIATDDLLRTSLAYSGGGLTSAVQTWLGRQAEPVCPGEIEGERTDGLPYTPPVIAPCSGAGLVTVAQIGT